MGSVPMVWAAGTMLAAGWVLIGFAGVSLVRDWHQAEQGAKVEQSVNEYLHSENAALKRRSDEQLRLLLSSKKALQAASDAKATDAKASAP
jgi:hypothetical protein